MTRIAIKPTVACECKWRDHSNCFNAYCNEILIKIASYMYCKIVSRVQVLLHPCSGTHIHVHHATARYHNTQCTTEGSIWPSGQNGPWICVNQYDKFDAQIWVL